MALIRSVELCVTEYEKGYFQKDGYDGYRDWEIHKQRADKIMKLAQPKSVLDVGCAYGYVVKHLIEKGIYAVGMDVSEFAEKMAQNHIPQNFVRHDMRETPYPFRTQEFDLVYCEGVLEHIEEEYIPRIMTEFARISAERIIQVSFKSHSQADKEEGHVLLMDNGWWLTHIPNGTWLAYQENATQDNLIWLYKG